MRTACLCLLIATGLAISGCSEGARPVGSNPDMDAPRASSSFDDPAAAGPVALYGWNGTFELSATVVHDDAPPVLELDGVRMGQGCVGVRHDLRLRGGNATLTWTTAAGNPPELALSVWGMEELRIEGVSPLRLDLAKIDFGPQRNSREPGYDFKFDATGTPADARWEQRATLALELLFEDAGEPETWRCA